MEFPLTRREVPRASPSYAAGFAGFTSTGSMARGSMPLTSESDDAACDLSALLHRLGIDEAAACSDAADPTSDAERALFGCLLLDRLKRPPMTSPHGRSPHGQLLQSLLEEAENSFGQQVILRYLREVGVRIAGEFPLPGAMPAGKTKVARKGASPASDISAADPSGKPPPAGTDPMCDPRRAGPQGRDSDPYVFAVLEGLYNAWFSRLDTMARVDGLTGIANRREFDRCLPIAWATAARRHEPLALIMIDVDRFKSFNDRYGHLAGDDCLRGIAGAIAGALRRPGDLAARYGGEEFVVVLPATDATGAREVGGAIRRAIRDVAIRHDDGVAGDLVTVSLGIAVCTPLPDVQHDDLTRIADEALYAAKRTGRNRAVLVDMRSWWI